MICRGKKISPKKSELWKKKKNQTKGNSEKIPNTIIDMKNTLLFLLAAFLLVQNCSPAKGEFGWAVSSNTEKGILEKELFVVTDYKMMRTGLIFSPADIVHYVYKFQWSPFQLNYSSSDEFFISLEKESLGFVEVDVKKKMIEPESYTLKDRFKSLEIGRYNLKVAFEGDVIDSVQFDVLPDEGYAIREDDINLTETDEILKYSR